MITEEVAELRSDNAVLKSDNAVLKSDTASLKAASAEFQEFMRIYHAKVRLCYSLEIFQI